MATRRPNRRQFDASTGPRFQGSTIRSVAPVFASPVDVAVQCDSSLIFPAVVGDDLSLALDAIRLVGVDALGGVFNNAALSFAPVSDSAFELVFSAGPVALDSDKPHAYYIPADCPLVRPAQGGVLRGWLDPTLFPASQPGVGGWVVCAQFVL